MGPLREDRQEEGICPICQECLKEAVRTDCGHLFCRACLAQHLEKASASGVHSCPLCRKPCSEGVLGAGYTCDSHQKKVCWFCEESRRLLCMECRMTPEHKSHRELAIENAISHYKERLNRRIRKLRKDICELQRLRTQEEERLQEMKADHGTHRLEAEQEQQPQTRRQQDAPAQWWPDQRQDVSAELSRMPGISRALLHLSSLVTDLEGMAKKLDTSLLKDASDLLNRSAPEQLEAIYPNLEKRINESLVQPSSAALTSSSLGHLISDSPHPPGSPSPNLSSLPLGLPGGPSDLPAPEHDLHSSSLELRTDA
ncbi:E3 ubiquitin ligase TRIM40 isoform 2-T3 [Dama dama]|uniref:E3 ubiquitin ligase TRIM40 isoform X2 n=1 Tax=Dama dama TaxID=30532 RepID=UPI002A3628D8|nr:E3 ubiquitin ligase TRIM40 isoform X2 [Dama dama]